MPLFGGGGHHYYAECRVPQMGTFASDGSFRGTQPGVKIFAALNLGYDEWSNFLVNRPMVEALLSRLRHYCHTVHINGPSLRDPQG
jgi:IstB-like ATP binding protein